MHRRRAVAVALAALALGPAAAHAAFPQTAPNDPDYDKAEENCLAESVNDQQHYLFSFPSACTPAATPGLLDGATGMSVDRAWRDFTAGRPDVLIAYVEGGINWHEPRAKDLVDQVFVNDGELPPPTTPKDDGRLNVQDFADSPDANGNGYVDAEDLIVRFSDGRDDDRNGYVDDVSGWDFYNDQNDPSTLDSAYTHANNQMRKAAGEADNGLLGTGVCPRCTVLPIKAGAEALDRSDDLAQAWLYAADIGASVLVSVTADLGYSSYMDQAAKAVFRRGTVIVAASNDFDSTDHQGGHFHPHVVPGNGMVANSSGIPGPPANLATTDYLARSGKTSWGTKNFVTVSTQEGSTSQSTPIHGGVYALLAAAGREAADQGRLAGGRLSAAEVLQVVRATASDVAGRTNWPSKPGWDLQFGYGRPHVHRAMTAIYAGDVPPVGWFSSPRWYQLVDPTRTRRLPITGHVEARRSPSWTAEVQVAPGAEPAEGDFATIGRRSGTKAFDGRLATLDLSRFPRSFWERAFALSRTKVLETNERYTVTLRLRVTDATGRVGEERRSIAVHHDPAWRDGFPRRIGPGGEAQPQLVDLQGRGRLAAVFGDSDGLVHAIDLTTARELPGWPARTARVRPTRRHRGIDPGHEPVIANAAVGDLDGTGRLSVVVTSTSGRTYAFDARGKRRRGWPRTLQAGVAPLPVPRPPRPYTRQEVRGAFAPPVLADLDQDGRPDVVQAAWDGRVHALDRRGRALPGWPVALRVTTPPPSGFSRIDDRKLSAAPAVAQLDGDPAPELVVRTQQADVLGPDISPAGRNYSFALDDDGSVLPGWPIAQRLLIDYYGSAQELITEGSNMPVAADVDGDGRDEVAISPLFSGTTLFGADGRERAVYGAVPAAIGTLLTGGDVSGALPADVPVSFTTSGAFGRFGGRLRYVEPGSNAVSIATALLTVGSGLPIVNVMRSFDARGGDVQQGFPAVSQGLNFLGGATIADVTGDGRTELLQGGDTSALHGYGADGKQVPGFPKFHTGWTLYAPAVGDAEGDGRTDVVLATREGELLAWETRGDAREGNAEWWSFRHDEHNTARHGTDTRPPSPVPALRRRGRTLRFGATGDDWRAGSARRYVVRERGRGGRLLRVRELAAPAPVRLAARTRRVEVSAIDDAGNRSTPTGLRTGR